MSTTQQKLDEALEARHKLLIGTRMVQFVVAGRTVQYTQADLPPLERYIAELRREIAGTSATPRRRVTYVVPD